MGQTTDQMAADIDRQRNALEANLRELEDRARAVTDWRQHFHRHPARMVAAALVGGMLLASLFRSRSRAH